MRPVKNYFNNQIANICTRVLELESLNAKISTLLPDALKNHCQAASFNQGVLILTITNPNLATELRFLKSELRDRLRKEAGLYQLTAIDIKIIEKPALASPGPKKRQSISKTAEQALNQLKQKLTCKNKES